MQSEKSAENKGFLERLSKKGIWFAGVFVVLAVSSIAFLAYQNWLLEKALGETDARHLAAQDKFETTRSALSDQIAILEAKLSGLSADLEEEREENEELRDELRDEKDRNDDFEDKIEDIAGTVGVLDKLSKTDKELLQKYSKVSFLNEHYVPSKLSKLDKEYAYDESREFYLHSNVVPFFEDMVEDAKDDGVDLWVVSAYRSFDTQAQLKGQYTVTFGSGANTFSADQGYSEHQLGTTLDFTTNNLGGSLQGFGNTPAYEWLTDNAHKYGFVLSYPEGNQYYVFEPWHWRFVGKDFAEYLHDEGLTFYDVEQRTIDEYLISIFD